MSAMSVVGPLDLPQGPEVPSRFGMKSNLEECLGAIMAGKHAVKIQTLLGQPNSVGFKGIATYLAE